MWVQNAATGFKSSLASLLVTAAANASGTSVDTPTINTWVRVAVPSSQQVSVDVEIFTPLANSEPILNFLLGPNFMGTLKTGKPSSGLYLSSMLYVGGIQLLAMTKPYAREKEQTFAPWRLQLDYRRPLAPNATNSSTTSSTVNASSATPGGATTTTTAGYALIEALMTHPAVSAAAGDGRDLSYMRDQLHAIGQDYGFLDLNTPAFGISWDLRVATDYDQGLDRASSPCSFTSSAASQFLPYSGMFGGDGYVDWTQQPWTEGRAMCNNDNCANPPYGEPSSTSKVVNAVDRVLGCVRLRLWFNCSTFSVGQCMQAQVDPEKNPVAANQYANSGSKSKYLDPEGWCKFNYPEDFGPNNPLQSDSTQRTARAKDYKYRYRLSPCIQCRQARDICTALQAGSTIVGSGENRMSDGNSNYAAEFDLGCFSRGHTSGVTWDTCCPDACSPNCVNADTATDAEPCLRATANPVCADPRHGTASGHTACLSQCSGTPRTCTSSSSGSTTAMCAKRDTFFEPM
mmetsp:Transcript_58127/g.152814  ORF Transcript_58127/g.152814 Transcript_58127/m.152814 type:complete len:516 (+) Transcript_58127:406-1953(+)